MKGLMDGVNRGEKGVKREGGGQDREGGRSLDLCCSCSFEHVCVKFGESQCLFVYADQCVCVHVCRHRCGCLHVSQCLCIW